MCFKNLLFLAFIESERCIKFMCFPAFDTAPDAQRRNTFANAPQLPSFHQDFANPLPPVLIIYDKTAYLAKHSRFDPYRFKNMYPSGQLIAGLSHQYNFVLILTDGLNILQGRGRGYGITRLTGKQRYFFSILRYYFPY